MKPKGISLIEQHCEKVFLALLAAAALGVVAMQFTGEGNTVDIGTSKGLRLDKAYEQIAAEAESKLGQLEESTPSPNVPEPDTGLVQVIAGAADRTPDAPVLASLTRPYADLGETGPAAGDDLVVEAVAVGTPARPEIGVFLGRIDPVYETTAAYNELFGEGPWPRDVRALTVETSFDAAGLRERLMTDPDGDGPASAAPIGFWRTRHLIARVDYERQERQADGSWSEPEPVGPVPGALDPTEMMKAAMGGDQVGQVMALLKGERGWEIVRPAFPPTVAPSVWAPPSYQQRLAQGETLEALEAELSGLVARGTSLRDAGTVPLWTHDFRVAPGQEYRYRARVWIPNPYYGFAAALAPESASLADDAFIVGDVSPWSAAVTAPRESYWYAFSATDGSDGSLAGRASCRVDVFGFIGGRWRTGQARFEPGDEIALALTDDDGVATTVNTGAVLLDIVEASLADPGARGRQRPLQIVAATPEGLMLREIWRDRADPTRRKLLEEASAGPEAASPEPAGGDRETRGAGPGASKTDDVR